MREKIMRQLLSEYATERAAALASANDRFAEVADRVPEVAQMQWRISRAYLETALQANQSNMDEETKQKTAKERILSIQREVKQALKQAGYPEDYLAIQYKCPICQDTGYVGEPVHTPCVCMQRRFQQRLAEQSGMQRVEGHTFAQFDLARFPEQARSNPECRQRDLMQKARDFCLRYAQEFPNSRRKNLIFLGESGLGKTFLMDCVANEVLRREFVVLRLTAFRFNEIARRYHRGQDEGNELELLMQVDLLCIDDLGSEPMFENITVEYLLALLNERQERGKATLIASNLSPTELQQRYTERVTSRLLDTNAAALIRLQGDDIRLYSEK